MVASLIGRHRGEPVTRRLDWLRREWSGRVGPGGAAAAEAAVCCEFMLRSLGRLNHIPLSGSVQELVRREFEGILSRIEAGDWHELGSPADHTYHVLRRCLVQVIPAGIYYFEYSGIPRSNLLKCPWRDKPRLLHFLATRLGGLRPTVEMHLPRLDRGRFTQDEVARSYRLVAKVLRAQPQLRGISGSSWFYDPEVARISPHLAFIRELIDQNRGLMHRLGPTEGALRGALAASEHRRRLHEEGRYQPTEYARYWARDDVLRWAEESS